MEGGKFLVYVAGPLFNVKEQQEMQELAECFEKAGFETFLPQRDGLELINVRAALIEKGIAPKVASDVVSRAIFALDVYQVVERCDVAIVNLNGRVPDEGAVSEAAMAFRSGKIVSGYKADARSVLVGEDNPLVVGLFDFKVANTYEELVQNVEHALSERPDREKEVVNTNERLDACLMLGRQIFETTKSAEKMERITALLCEEAASFTSAGGS